MSIVNGPIPKEALVAPGYGAGFAVNGQRGPVRVVDPSLFPPNAFTSQLLYSSESVWVLASRVPARGAGPKRHTHPVDQWFYSLKGQLRLDIAGEKHTTNPGSVAYFPAGTPHYNWNETDQEEIHLEVMMPGIPPTAPIMYWEPEEARLPPQPGLVTRVCEDQWVTTERLPGFAVQWLLNPQNGFKHGIVYVAKSEPGAGFTRTHVHPFDQIYFILEGTMKVTLGFRTFEAGPNSIVIIPAGVPHSNVNSGSGIETHVAMNVPPPAGPSTRENPWDTPVEFKALDEFIV